MYASDRGLGHVIAMVTGMGERIHSADRHPQLENLKALNQ